MWYLPPNDYDGSTTGESESGDHGPEVPDMMAGDPDSSDGQSSLNDEINFIIYNAHVLV